MLNILQKTMSRHQVAIQPGVPCGFAMQVHSTTRTNQQRGLDLAAAALDNDQQTPDQDRELRYYTAGEVS